jgi:hypothetical protein
MRKISAFSALDVNGSGIANSDKLISLMSDNIGSDYKSTED